MQICVTWIVLLIGCQQQILCDDYKNDFEVFDTFTGHGSGGPGKSQSLYPEPSSFTFDFLNDDDDDGSRSKRYANEDLVDLSTYDRVPQQPAFTQTRHYIAPQDVEKRFTRSAQNHNYGNQYSDGYKAFLEKYFKENNNEGPDYESQANGNGDESKSSQYRQAPDDVEQIEHEHQSPKNRAYDDDYNSSEYERIKALSKEQEKEIKQNPKHCKVEVKGDMKCSICKNPETGAHSESCSFSSTPDEKKYAYVKERNYNSKDQDKDDEGDDDEEEEEENASKEAASNKNEKKVTTSTQAPRQQQRRGNGAQRVLPLRSPTTTSKPATTSQRSSNRRYSASYKAEESRPQHRVIGLDPFLYGQHSSELIEKVPSSSKGRSYDDYFAHVFPEAKNGKLKLNHNEDDDDDDDNDDSIVEFIPSYDSKKNVEKVLAEFKTKDWSTCKKEIKGDLTCYQCKDDDGVRHEECMFVSGSAASPEPPKSSRLSYSETKEYHRPNNSRHRDTDDHSNASSKLVAKTVDKPSRKLVVRKRKAKVNNHDDDSGAPNPADVEEHHSGTKKSIKRMVSYRIENNNNDTPAESMVFEHQVSHIL